MKKEMKPFEYMELKAMCMICVAEASILIAFREDMKFKNQRERRELIERKIEKIIDVRWNHPEKKVIS